MTIHELIERLHEVANTENKPVLTQEVLIHNGQGDLYRIAQVSLDPVNPNQVLLEIDWDV